MMRPVQVNGHSPADISPWCLSGSKRAVDIIVSGSLLVIAFPLAIVCAFLVMATSRGPLFFRQQRVGRGGRHFVLLKFRTMQHSRPLPGLALTRRGDLRVTAVGRVLRTFKLDELPQLLNILYGEMSLVGPRPDVPEHYCSLKGPAETVFVLTPGATGVATLRYRDEEELLSRVPDGELFSFYTRVLLPTKIMLDLEYARTASFYTDICLLFRTAMAIFRKTTLEPSEIDALFDGRKVQSC